ncbi:MAG: hypothetical protein WAX66_00300 [Patescibacteria group bacterium]
MNLLLSLVIFFSTAILTTIKSFAVCPVCIVAVGAGLGVSRYLGIDDTIMGVWIGGLVVASALWFASIIQKKKWKIPYPEALSTVSFLLLTIIPMYIKKIIGNPTNILWGMDKITLGIVAGLITFIISVYLDKTLRKTNHGEVYIYYQKVILPVLLLTIVSFTFYSLT